MAVKKISTIFGVSNFYSRSILFTGLSLLAAIFNYALYPIIARILTIDSFGEFSALLALVTQIGGVLLAFNVISIYLVAKYGQNESKKYLSSIQKSLIVFFSILSILCLLFFPFISNLLKISSSFELVALGLILLLAIPSSIWSGYFQGNGEIVRVGAFSLFTSLSKLVLAIFGAYEAGLTGALVGVLAGTFLGLVVFWALPGTKPPITSTLSISKDDKVIIKKFAAIIARSIVAVAILSIIQIFDLLSIKALFSTTEAGQYAGISTLSRVVYYVGFIIIWVLLPEIAKATKTHRINLIRKSYLTYSLIIITFTIGAITIGQYAIKTLLGEGYSASPSIILWSIIFQSAVLVITFQTFVLLILNGMRFIYALVFGLLAMSAYSIFIDSSVLELLRLYALTLVVLSVIFGIIIAKKAKNEKTN